MTNKVNIQRSHYSGLNHTGHLWPVISSKITINFLRAVAGALNSWISASNDCGHGKNLKNWERPVSFMMWYDESFSHQLVVKIIFKNNQFLNNNFLVPFCAFYCLGLSSGPSVLQSEPQDLNTCTARTTYCRQIGHSFIRLPHLVQVTMWPHSNRTQSITASMQIRHKLSSSSSCSCNRSPSEKQQRGAVCKAN